VGPSRLDEAGKWCSGLEALIPLEVALPKWPGFPCHRRGRREGGEVRSGGGDAVRPARAAHDAHATCYAVRCCFGGPQRAVPLLQLLQAADGSHAASAGCCIRALHSSRRLMLWWQRALLRSDSMRFALCSCGLSRASGQWRLVPHALALCARARGLVFVYPPLGCRPLLAADARAPQYPAGAVQGAVDGAAAVLVGLWVCGAHVGAAFRCCVSIDDAACVHVSRVAANGRATSAIEL
jgi:hypothetical protein